MQINFGTLYKNPVIVSRTTYFIYTDNNLIALVATGSKYIKMATNSYNFLEKNFLIYFGLFFVLYYQGRYEKNEIEIFQSHICIAFDFKGFSLL